MFLFFFFLVIGANNVKSLFAPFRILQLINCSVCLLLPTPAICTWLIPMIPLILQQFSIHLVCVNTFVLKLSSPITGMMTISTKDSALFTLLDLHTAIANP